MVIDSYKLREIFFALILGFPGIVTAEIKVEITGVTDALKKEILDSLVIARQFTEESITEARVRALYRRSQTEVNDTLKSNGYYDYRITNNLEQVDANWVVSFTIVPGDPIIIRTLNITIEGDGRDDAVLAALVDEFPLKSGNVLNHGLYENGKRRLQNLARERGYFDSSFTTHVINIKESEKSADINLVFSSAMRYRFGEVFIEETVVSRQRLEKLIPFRTGDGYDANMLIRLNKNFRDSNYFNEVKVTPEIDNLQDRSVPVTVMLVPKPKNNYKIGAGYGTDSGPRIIAGWESRYLNRNGHRLETSLKASPKLSMVGAKYITPDFRKIGTELDLLSSVTRENTDTYSSTTYIFGAQQLQKRRSWNETLSLSYQLADFKVAGISTYTTLLIPAVSYYKTVSESPIYTNQGYRLNIGLKGSLKGVQSDLSFIQTTVNGKYILPAGEDGRIIARAELGATQVQNFDELPTSIRYFAGGDNNIRGFDIQSQGPRNSDGDVIGGKYLAVGSIEYEHRIYEKFSAAVFTDFGNAFNSFSDHFVYSTGAGIRWLTPVGLVRLDLGFGISEDSGTFRLHFNIGPDL